MTRSALCFCACLMATAAAAETMQHQYHAQCFSASESACNDDVCFCVLFMATSIHQVKIDLKSRQYAEPL
jgi:ferredoxin-thioredoxin reductase catalytic subunit